MNAVNQWLAQRVYFDPNSGCWLWLGCVDRHGYGQMTLSQKHYIAHRYVYAMYRGACPATPLHHKCEVPCCVNPDHLEALTQSDHQRLRHPEAMKKAWTRSRATRMARTHCRRGHPFSGDNLILNRRGRECRACLRARRAARALLP